MVVFAGSKFVLTPCLMFPSFVVHGMKVFTAHPVSYSVQQVCEAAR